MTRPQLDGFAVRNATATEAEIFLYDEIGEWGISARRFAQELKALGPVAKITVRINSPGGQIFDGFAIYHLLKRHSAHVVVTIDSLAASMASVVAMAGDEVRIAATAMLMIHDPLAGEYGDADDLRDMADLLDQLKASIVGAYVARTGLDADKVGQLMADETWLTAEQAVALGFASAIDEPLAVTACVDPARYHKTPTQFLSQKSKEPSMSEPQPATYAELKAAFPQAEPAFYCQQMEARATVDAAKANWQQHQLDQAQARVEAAEKKAADAKAEADRRVAEAKTAADKAKAAAAAPGVDPLPEGRGETGTEGGYRGFWDLVAKKEATGTPRAKAVSAVVREEPELHKAMIAEANQGRK